MSDDPTEQATQTTVSNISISLDLEPRQIDGMTHGTWKNRWEYSYDPIPQRTLFQTFKNAFELFSTRDCIGKLVETTQTDGSTELTVEYQSYTQVWEQAVHFASGQYHLSGNSPSEFVSLYSKNKPEWCIADIATMILGWTTVPIPATVDTPDMSYIFNHAEVTVAVVSLEKVPVIISVLPLHPKIKLLVSMDPLSNKSLLEYCKSSSSNDYTFKFAEPRLSKIRNCMELDDSQKAVLLEHHEKSLRLNDVNNLQRIVIIVDYDDLIQVGTQHKLASALEPEDSSKSIVTIVYTSGSTGRPKGAVNTYDRWNNFVSYLYNMPLPLVRLSFMPLAHNTERQQAHLTFLYGGKFTCSRGDMKQIFDEFRAVNPTILSAAPRFFDSIFAQYQAALEQFRKQYPDVPLYNAEEYCMTQFRGVLGNSMMILVVGGAAVSTATKSFMSRCFQGCGVFEGYGTTEAGGIAAEGKLYAGTEVMLVDCPDLGYTTADQPYPRGEVYVKTNMMVSGYYKDPETTKEYFKDGWFVTGDICEKRGDEYVYIDRRKNLFKLTQGVFVAPTALENKLIVSKFLHQIYVYGDHTRDCLVAIIVPNFKHLTSWLLEQNHLSTSTLQEYLGTDFQITAYSDVADVANKLLSCSKVENFKKFVASMDISRTRVQKDLVITGIQINLPSYHVPVKVYLEHEVWTPENRLVTPSDKPQRAALERKYIDVIKAMYNDSDHVQKTRSEIADQVIGVVNDVVSPGYPGSPDGQSIDITQHLATDSLATLKLVHVLNKKFNTDLTFSDLIKETQGNLTSENIVALMADRKSNTKDGASSSSSNNQSDLWASQNPFILPDRDMSVTVDPALRKAFIENLKRPQSEGVPNTVFITGATGFLGIHFTYNLLKENSNVQAYLLIRGKDKGDCESRFYQTCSTQCLDDIKQYSSRINFVPGDLALENFGVEKEEYQELANLIDIVYHVGAAVNWIWTYTALREPNVLGTIRVLQFASTFKLKWFFYVSSISTSGQVSLPPSESNSDLVHDYEGRGPLEETSLLRKEQAVYLGAYAMTKWVAESIVKRSIYWGLPGAILRPGMITGHSVSGACHTTDFGPRLLAGLVNSKQAFQSDLPLEWMPVDYCANAIRLLADNFRNNIFPKLAENEIWGAIPCFNIQNHQMVSFSTLNSILNELGHTLNITDYSSWRSSIAENTNSPLWPLLPFFGTGDQCQFFMQSYPAPHTNHILQSIPLKCPQPDVTMFKVYLVYLKQKGLI